MKTQQGIKPSASRRLLLQENLIPADVESAAVTKQQDGFPKQSELKARFISGNKEKSHKGFENDKQPQTA